VIGDLNSELFKVVVETLFAKEVDPKVKHAETVKRPAKIFFFIIQPSFLYLEYIPIMKYIFTNVNKFCRLIYYLSYIWDIKY
jgi:hypothetical protein